MSSKRQVVVLVAAASCASFLCLFGTDLQDAPVEPLPAASVPKPPSETARARSPSLTTIVRHETGPNSQPSAAADLEGHPHPITPEHERIQRELQLIQQLNDALDLRDAPHLRVLIADYAREYPDDPNAMRAGYERVADCIEEPGERTREAGRDYYERERASTLRRYVRRICLE
ncbi:MAG TPA: hypothetical protein VFG30_03600 [Polyangiales bacterium]|nr:hypothetical protein [Polyangiales bacterium]